MHPSRLHVRALLHKIADGKKLYGGRAVWERGEIKKAGRAGRKRLFHDALLKHDVGIQSLFSGCDNAVYGFGLLVKFKALIVTDGIRASFVMLCDNLFVLVPNGGFDFITWHNLHQMYRLVHIRIEREYFKNGIQQLRYAVAVSADNNSIFAHGGDREIAVAYDKTVAVGDKILGIPFNIMKLLLSIVTTR